MKIKIKILLAYTVTVCLNYFQNNTHGQELTEPGPIIMPSPNAASLGHYVEAPVNNFTGLPIINIPLYQIKSGSLSHNINLSYHPGGIKVAQEASWVGLGWALNAGGVITRVVRDRDDFGLESAVLGYGYAIYSSKDQPTSVNNTMNAVYVPDPHCPIQLYRFSIPPEISSKDDENWFYDVISDDRDSEPDMFMFNFGSFSGKFFFSGCNLSTQNCDVLEAKSMENDDLEIKYFRLTETWLVTDGLGNKYYFEEAERSRTYSRTDKSTLYVNEDEVYGVAGMEDTEIKTAWYLTKIESASTDDHIVFNYKSSIHTSLTRPAVSVVKDNFRTGELYNDRIDNYTISQTVIYNKYLESIQFSGGTIHFSTSEREDIENPINTNLPPQKLDRINVYQSGNAQPIWTVEFLTNYFKKMTTPNPIYARLKLNGIELGGYNDPHPQRYGFIYHESGSSIPKKNSFATDYWGYFNDRNNSQPVPYYTFKFPGTPPTYMTHHGANRRPDAEASKIFHLTQVKYPTGGTHTYEMEPNQYGNNLFDQYAERPPKIVHTLNASNYSWDENPTPFSTKEFTLSEAKIVKYEARSCAWDQQNLSDRFANIEKWNLFHGTWEDADVLGWVSYTYPTIDNSGWCDPSLHYNSIYDLDYDSGDDVYRMLELGPGKYRIVLTPNPNTEAEARISYESGEIFVEGVKEGAGLRVRRIVIDDGIKSNTKEYDYRLSDGRCSGVLIAPPDFAFEDMLTSYSLSPLSTASGSYVGYGSVKTSYFNFKGDLNGYEINNFHVLEEQYTNHEESPNVPRQPYPLNGKPSSKTYYSGSRKKAKEIGYEYEVFEDYNNKIYGLWGPDITIIDNYICEPDYPDKPVFRYAMYYYDFYPTWVKLISKKEVHFNRNATANLRKNTIYSYNDKNTIPSTITTYVGSSLNESPEVNVSTYKYYENEPSILQGSDVLRSKHMIAVPIEKVEQRNGNTTSIIRHYFKEENTLSLLDKIELLPTGSSSLITNYYNHNASGKIVEQWKDSDMHTVFIWGYNGKYPVAQIEGAELDEVKSLFGGALPNLTGVLSSSQESILRNGLPQAMITTYEYAPLIGLIRETDSNGRKRNYVYDNGNRLYQSIDHDNNVLKEYSYQYHYE